MASGCIMGNCCRCGDLVWEDEDYNFISVRKLIHKKCNVDESLMAYLLDNYLEKMKRWGNG